MISMKQVTKTYTTGAVTFDALKGIDLEIGTGEQVAVVGPSGSGKTTLLTLVGALRSAQEGSVQIMGEELLNAKQATLEKVRRQIGFIFQQHNLLGALNALDQRRAEASP